MSLRNHCDVCGQELPEDFGVVALGRDRTPTKMHVRIREEPGYVRYAEVCGETCAHTWVREHWDAEFGVRAAALARGEVPQTDGR